MGRAASTPCREWCGLRQVSTKAWCHTSQPALYRGVICVSVNYSFVPRPAHRLAGLVASLAAIAACAPTASPGIPPAPILLRWPDPAFDPEQQCHGTHRVEDLARYLPRARLAMSLPGTNSVGMDTGRRCLTVKVQSVGSGRLAELVLRGVAVPRDAVLLTLAD
jgi:hypothetical protein